MDANTVTALLGGGAAILLGSATSLLFTRDALNVFPTWRVKPYLHSEEVVSSPSPVPLRLVSAVASTNESVKRRIVLAGSKTSLAAFRRNQRRWTLGLSLAAVTLTVLGAAAGTLNPFGAAAMLLIFPLSGLMLPDYLLNQAAKKRQLQLNQELPDAIELLALAVGAGESLYVALGRVADRCTQVTGEELIRLMGEINRGESLAPSLTSWRTRSESEILSHLVDAVVSALERGSPLAEVLREQVADSRAAARNQLLAQGGKKDVWMMVPVVFLILPLTVVFALYPGLVALQLTTIH
ncbi:MAG: type II secretion system F family protein [Mobiluncus porci]|uniref:Type II secretion system protein GspF domain-containing protein n=1 Tax=Mobiluncus porci TaxID=2652278 RepID=A0A7K0K1T5_9ACTO|nr:MULTISPECIES: type II secretion system F family protein [Mobiluncus]MCI6584247.1 type II secretion system F family protein [Mobiluncus sp.]MDD7540752.1 type II secretion system F family protein [Mobiluncus porci]MDY5748314.1 type II secretion system F family protein [Mobiluncus porci]MST49379.1 hypothetical protein [Mobiluncus porci]